MNDCRALLHTLGSRRDLSSVEMADFLESIIDESITPIEIAAVLGALRTKGESLSELVGAARTLRQHAVHIDCGFRTVVDIVGTGGDCSNSFNVSTTAALIAAGAGVVVAKHGNRSVSSLCGAADVLAELGFSLDTAPAQMEYAIQTHGIGFLFAGKLHPAMARVAPIRQQLKVRTIFNLLGPLINPAGANAMVVGVFAPELVELFACALRELGVKRAMVVHGMNGIDEISVSAPTRVAELRDGEIRTGEVHPEMFFDRMFAQQQIRGGAPAENARILNDVLTGKERDACRAIALLNAAAAIYVSGRAADLREGLEQAEASIDSGCASQKLQLLIQESQL